MARIKYGSIATEIRGSIGGTTFQGNAYGFTVKNKANMARLQSVSQNEKHRIVTEISQRWFIITQAQRDHWNAFALAHPVPAKHNSDAVLTGYTYFLKYNLIRCNSGVSPLDEPTDGTITLPVVYPSVRLDSPYLWWNNNAGGVYLDWAFNCYLSPPQKATQSYNMSKTRYMAHGNITAGDVQVDAGYKSFFGVLPAVGDILFAEFQPWGLYIPFIPQSQYFVIHVV
jgi:hypothetical protein